FTVTQNVGPYSPDNVFVGQQHSVLEIPFQTAISHVPGSDHGLTAVRDVDFRMEAREETDRRPIQRLYEGQDRGSVSGSGDDVVTGQVGQQVEVDGRAFGGQGRCQTSARASADVRRADDKRGTGRFYERVE